MLGGFIVANYSSSWDPMFSSGPLEHSVHVHTHTHTLKNKMNLLKPLTKIATQYMCFLFPSVCLQVIGSFSLFQALGATGLYLTEL